MDSPSNLVSRSPENSGSSPILRRSPPRNTALLHGATNAGLITEGAVRTRRCYSRKALQLLLDRGLLHVCAEGYTVHDWQQWNPSDSTAAERQRRHRARLASRDKSVTDTVTRPVTNRDETVTLARADARARNEYEY